MTKQRKEQKANSLEVQSEKTISSYGTICSRQQDLPSVQARYSLHIRLAGAVTPLVQ